MKNNIRVKIVISLAGVLLLVAACTSPSPYADANPAYINLLDTGPCWKTICPRETSLQKALTTLSTIETGYSGLIEPVPNKNTYLMPFIAGRFEGSTVELDYLDRVILRIELSLSPNELSLSQIIDYFGFPTRVSSSDSCGTGDFAGFVYGFSLWYNDKGITVTSTEIYTQDQPIMVKLEPRYSISRLIYHPPFITPEQWIQELGGEIEDLSPLYMWTTWNDLVPIETCQER